jgi:hypothetical protein
LGFYLGTFFESSNLSCKQVFMLSYYFLTGTHRIEDILFAMELDGKRTISLPTIVEWNKRFRAITSSYFDSHPIKLGGPGKEVQIDETVIGRRKYNVISPTSRLSCFLCIAMSVAYRRAASQWISRQRSVRSTR